MSADLVFQVAALLTGGAIVYTHTHSAQAFDPKRHPGRFVCLTRSNDVVESLEAWDETTSDGRPHDRRGNGCVWVTRARQDWSAFGAARAFVSACKAADVERAIKRARAR